VFGSPGRRCFSKQSSEAPKTSKYDPKKSHRLFNFGGESPEFVEVENPYTQQIVGEEPFLSQEDVQTKLQQALEAHHANGRRTLDQRKEIVLKITQFLLDNKEKIASQITEHVGKPISQAREEIDLAVEQAKAMVELSEEALRDEIVQQTEVMTRKIRLDPKGIVLALLPWDFPVMEIINCLVPSILCGNAVLLKDSPEAPLISQFFEDAVADIAPCVAQRFFMNPMKVHTLYQDRLIDYLVFSGNYGSALDISNDLAKNDFIASNIDLGGHNTAYIDEISSSLDNTERDKLLEKIVDKCLWGTYYNTGQSRNSIESIVVHQSMINKFTNMFTDKVYETLKLMNPALDECQYGCINLE